MHMHNGWICIHTYRNVFTFFITGNVHNRQMPICLIIFISNHITRRDFKKLISSDLGFRKMLDMHFHLGFNVFNQVQVQEERRTKYLSLSSLWHKGFGHWESQCVVLYGLRCFAVLSTLLFQCVWHFVSWCLAFLAFRFSVFCALGTLSFYV